MKSTPCSAILVMGVGLALSAGAAWASETASAVSADDALKQLREGNARFVAGDVKHPHEDAERRQDAAANGQKPVVTILSCSDSRVPLEVLFDQGIGDVFVIRVAGNICGPSELGTVEYGVGHLHTPVLVVLGHSKCGAVTAAATNAEVHGHIAPLVEQIKPAVEHAHQANPKAEGDELVKLCIRTNVWEAVGAVLTKSEEVRELIKAGQLRVVGAVYDLESGKVEWMGPHPQQKELLEAKTRGPRAGAEHAEASPGLPGGLLGVAALAAGAFMMRFMRRRAAA